MVAHELGPCGGHTITGSAAGSEASGSSSKDDCGTELNFLFLSHFDGRPEGRGGTYGKAESHLQYTMCMCVHTVQAQPI